MVLKDRTQLLSTIFSSKNKNLLKICDRVVTKGNVTSSYMRAQNKLNNTTCNQGGSRWWWGGTGGHCPPTINSKFAPMQYSLNCKFLFSACPSNVNCLTTPFYAMPHTVYCIVLVDITTHTYCDEFPKNL